jgi:hypothetical protein
MAPDERSCKLVVEGTWKMNDGCKEWDKVQIGIVQRTCTTQTGIEKPFDGFVGVVDELFEGA